MIFHGDTELGGPNLLRASLIFSGYGVIATALQGIWPSPDQSRVRPADGASERVAE